METFNFSNVTSIELSFVLNKMLIAIAPSEEGKVQIFSPRIGVEKKGEILSIWEKHSMKALLKEPIMGFSPPYLFEKTFFKEKGGTEGVLFIYLPPNVTITGVLKTESVIETDIEEDFKKNITFVK